MSALVAVNLVGTVEQAEVGSEPYRVSRDGQPYVPVGDGGIVLGVRLGDTACGLDTDHVAPGACIVGRDDAAAHALAAYACIGNRVEVRSGAAAGAIGAVVGKRGEGNRVIVSFAQPDLARLRPGDQISVRACGQGSTAPVPEVTSLNAAPGLLEALAIEPAGELVRVPVRAVYPSKFIGNGIGRPTSMWAVELTLARGPGSSSGPQLKLGDLVAVTDLDTRFNAGYRRGWITVGLIVHGTSPLPGHGPGITPILTGPAARFELEEDEAAHRGLTDSKTMEVVNASA